MSVVHASPQSPPATGQKMTLSGGMIGGYTFTQRNVLEAAELMPEADYSFKPTAETHPFGQLISHLALTQFNPVHSSRAARVRRPPKRRMHRSKAVLIALLKESAKFCDPLVNAMTDEGMVQLMKAGPNELARGLALAGLNTHGNEMYGTIPVYLRLKGIVPPTPARQNPAPTKSN